MSTQTFAYPTLCKERKGWGTRRFAARPMVSIGYPRETKRKCPTSRTFFARCGDPAFPLAGYETFGGLVLQVGRQLFQGRFYADTVLGPQLVDLAVLDETVGPADAHD
jgi:hypothetical protein